MMIRRIYPEDIKMLRGIYQEDQIDPSLLPQLWPTLHLKFAALSHHTFFFQQFRKKTFPFPCPISLQGQNISLSRK